MMLLSVTLGVPFSQVRQFSSAEISLYQAYYGMEPWGDMRADLRNALAIKHTIEAAGAKPVGKDRFELSDFLLFGKKEKKAMEPSSLRERLAAAFRAKAKK